MIYRSAVTADTRRPVQKMLADDLSFQNLQMNLRHLAPPPSPSAAPPSHSLPAVSSLQLRVTFWLFLCSFSSLSFQCSIQMTLSFFSFFFFFEQMNSLFSIKQGIQDMNWKVNLIKKKTRKGKMNKASPASVNHYWIYFFYKREGGDKEM